MNYSEEILTRLRRVEGQVRGVIAMMEKGEHCKDVVGQLKAIRNAVDKAIAHIVAVNLEQCLLEEEEPQNRQNKIKEALALLISSR